MREHGAELGAPAGDARWHARGAERQRGYPRKGVLEAHLMIAEERDAFTGAAPPLKAAGIKLIMRPRRRARRLPR